MEKNENYTDQQWNELSENQREEAVKIGQAVDQFLASHLRYEECEENREKLEGYLDEHNLPITAATLHLAFVELGDTLKLVPLATPLAAPVVAPAPTQPPAPTPTAPDPRAPMAMRNGRVIEWTNPRPL